MIPKENENWYGYGTELLAVADAVVSSVKNDLPDNVPLSGKGQFQSLKKPSPEIMSSWIWDMDSLHCTVI
jgi:hypothetical protein